MAYKYEYPRPMLTVDAIIYRKNGNELEILLIKRGREPYKDSWALPGGFVEIDEDLINAIERETHEETGLSNIKFTQFKAYGKPGRDPRGRTVSIVFYGESPLNQKVQSGDDASDAKWFNTCHLPDLAFDHNLILSEWIKKQTG